MKHGPVVVQPMRLGLRDDEPTREWFAYCDTCGWGGRYRDDERDAKTDAARHRRANRG